MRFSLAVFCSLLVILMDQAHAALLSGPGLYATGAFDPEDLGETPRQLFRINPVTGIATVVATNLAGEPAGLAGAPDGRLFGIDTDGFGPNANSQLLQINRQTGAFTPVGSPVPGGTFGFDILSDGRGFTIPLAAAGGVPQLHSVNLSTGAFTPIGAANAIEQAFVSQFGLATGQNVFVNNLGSVGSTLYAAVRYGTNRNLIAIDPSSGDVAVIGALNALGATGGGVGLSGVDTNGDGIFDTLYGINNYDADFNVLGQIGVFDLSSGTFSVIGENPGFVFSGLASFPVPEPASLSLVALAGLLVVRHRRRGA